ncbi:MAG: hypothetical protein ACKO16_09355 [Gemmataceae bacterium]
MTNVVAEGINSKFMYIKRRAGRYRNIENFQKPSCSTLADSISTHGNAGWTNIRAATSHSRRPRLELVASFIGVRGTLVLARLLDRISHRLG